MVNAFSDWLCSVLLLGAIVTLAGLSFHVFVSPILSVWTALAGLVAVVVVALFWPKY